MWPRPNKDGIAANPDRHLVDTILGQHRLDGPVDATFVLVEVVLSLLVCPAVHGHRHAGLRVYRNVHTRLHQRFARHFGHLATGQVGDFIDHVWR